MGLIMCTRTGNGVGASTHGVELLWWALYGNNTSTSASATAKATASLCHGFFPLLKKVFETMMFNCLAPLPLPEWGKGNNKIIKRRGGWAHIVSVRWRIKRLIVYIRVMLRIGGYHFGDIILLVYGTITIHSLLFRVTPGDKWSDNSINEIVQFKRSFLYGGHTHMWTGYCDCIGLVYACW